jgi:short-subunit dehydrogenase
MKPKLKPLDQQVMVITGASSGIGLATARLAAERGAKVVLAARSGEALDELARDLTQSAAGEAVAVAADVSQERDVDRIAQVAIERFGRIDTWVNNAAVAIYGRVRDVPLPDARQLMEVTFWGTVHGSLVAVNVLRHGGGALINVGSVESDRAMPYHAYYAAAKHAIRGFTEALRMEVERDAFPISLTLIKPGSINTPFVEHARSYMEASARPTYPPPVYDPRLVADGILHCATHRVRDFVVGGGGRMLSGSARLPRLADRLMEATMFSAQRSGRPGPEADNLYAPASAGAERGPYEGATRRRSLYTTLEKHPAATSSALLLGAGAALGAWMISRR